jgi:GR25 family glycosyltransferase involved in LPS biosynthesis
MIPNFRRFPAIDGQTVDRSVLIRDGIIADDLNYNPGSLGNALSHISLWNLAVKENQSLTICEDDAVFHQSFCRISKTILGGLPTDWHFVLWGWNFDSLAWFDMIPGVSGCIALFDQPALRRGIKAFQSADLNPRPFRLFQAFGTLCYSISSAGARLLRDRCLPLKNSSIYFPGMKAALANTNLDIALDGIYSTTNCYLSFPPIVVTENDHSLSTVQQPPDVQ